MNELMYTVFCWTCNIDWQVMYYRSEDDGGLYPLDEEEMKCPECGKEGQEDPQKK